MKRRSAESYDAAVKAARDVFKSYQVRVGLAVLDLAFEAALEAADRTDKRLLTAVGE